MSARPKVYKSAAQNAGRFAELRDSYMRHGPRTGTTRAGFVRERRSDLKRIKSIVRNGQAEAPIRGVFSNIRRAIRQLTGRGR